MTEHNNSVVIENEKEFNTLWKVANYLKHPLSEYDESIVNALVSLLATNRVTYEDLDKIYHDKLIRFDLHITMNDLANTSLGIREFFKERYNATYVGVVKDSVIVSRYELMSSEESPKSFAAVMTKSLKEMLREHQINMYRCDKFLNEQDAFKILEKYINAHFQSNVMTQNQFNKLIDYILIIELFENFVDDISCFPYSASDVIKDYYDNLKIENISLTDYIEKEYSVKVIGFTDTHVIAINRRYDTAIS